MPLSAPCCRGGRRLEPVQRRLVTLATREGVVFGRRGRMALPKPPYRTSSRTYMYRRSRRGTLYVQRCTIKPPSSWQDARRKTPNDLVPAPLSSLSLFLSVFPILLPSSYLILFHREAAFSDSTFCLFYFSPLPLPLPPVLFRPLHLNSVRLDVAGLCNCLPVA